MLVVVIFNELILEGFVWENMHGGSLCPRTVIFPLLSRTLAITEMRTLSCPQALHFTCFFSRYCLISYRVGDRHYRIFPDFLNSGFSKAYTTEGKAKVTACSWNDYSRLLQITPDYSRLLQKVNILQQRTVVLLLWRTSIKNLEKRKIKSETFATWKYWKYRIPELFDKKIWRKNSRI